jgi:hypothetical protein
MMNNMIKTILCIFLFSQTLFGYSKGNFLFPGITFKSISLQEINKDSTLKIIKGLKEYKRIFGLADIYDTVNHFYLSDIDNDKKNELIYYGLISAEGKWSIIWKIDRQNYYLFGELFGQILGISDSSYIATLGSGCLGSDFDYANLYRIVEDGIDFLQSIVIFNRIKTLNSLYLRSAVLANGVTIPDSLPIKKNIVINSIGYSLRTQPSISDKPDSTDIKQYGVLRGNTIVELNKGTVAWATAMHKDNTGTVWWFLVLDNPQEAKYNVYKGYKKEKRRICGWISTKDLDYKEIK